MRTQADVLDDQARRVRIALDLADLSSAVPVRLEARADRFRSVASELDGRAALVERLRLDLSAAERELLVAQITAGLSGVRSLAEVEAEINGFGGSIDDPRLQLLLAERADLLASTDFYSDEDVRVALAQVRSKLATDEQHFWRSPVWADGDAEVSEDDVVQIIGVLDSLPQGAAAEVLNRLSTDEFATLMQASWSADDHGKRGLDATAFVLGVLTAEPDRLPEAFRVLMPNGFLTSSQTPPIPPGQRQVVADAVASAMKVDVDFAGFVRGGFPGIVAGLITYGHDSEANIFAAVTGSARLLINDYPQGNPFGVAETPFDLGIALVGAEPGRPERFARHVIADHPEILSHRHFDGEGDRRDAQLAAVLTLVHLQLVESDPNGAERFAEDLISAINTEASVHGAKLVLATGLAEAYGLDLTLDEPMTPAEFGLMLLSFAPGGDSIDIVNESIIKPYIRGEETDELTLALAEIGLILDLGWANGLVPDPVDGANVSVGVVKETVKKLSAEARAVVLIALRKAEHDPNKLVDLFHQLRHLRREDVLAEFGQNTAALKLVLDAPPGVMDDLVANPRSLELIRLLQSHGDEIMPVLNRYGPDAGHIIAKHGTDVLKMIDGDIADATRRISVVKEHGQAALDAILNHGKAAVDLVKTYGADGAAVINRYGKDGIDILRRDGRFAIDFIADYGRFGFDLLKDHGSEVKRFIKLHGGVGDQLLGNYGADALKLVDLKHVENTYTHAHTINKHVGKTDAEILARFKNNPPPSAVSSFRTLEDANRLTATVLEKNSEALKRWMAREARRPNPEPLRLEMSFDPKTSPPTGRFAQNGDKTVGDTWSIKVVLVVDASSPTGFYVLSSFPIK